MLAELENPSKGTRIARPASCRKVGVGSGIHLGLDGYLNSPAAQRACRGFGRVSWVPLGRKVMKWSSGLWVKASF